MPELWGENGWCEMSESNLIYRRDAIDAIKSMMTNLKYGKSEREALYDAQNLMCHIPSVQQWIPCDERLPMQTGEYLVTVHYRNWGYFVDVFGYTPTVYGWYDPDNTDFDWSPYVIAWMPLPDPWKGEKDELTD